MSATTAADTAATAAAAAGRGDLRRGLPALRWRRSPAGQVLGLGVLVAVVTSAAPSAAFLVLVISAGLAAGSIVTAGRGGLRPAGRIAGTGLGATVVAFVLLMPWPVALVAGPDRWQALTGLASSPGNAPGWGAVLRLAVGPIGNTPLSWAFLASAALPLVIGSRWRLGWAGRAWILALVAFILTWATGHGWLGALTPSATVLLAPAAVGVALAVGLGAAAFESDLPGYNFGWRQVATVVAAVAAAVGVIPVLVASSSGRWDMPLTGYGQATAWMGGRGAPGNFRVLWLGDPRVLPGGGWQVTPGLSYSISEDGLGDSTQIWSGSSPGAAAAVGDAVRLARAGSTVRLGGLLAPYAIRYVVVVDALAPSIPGFQSPPQYLPPSDVEPALLSQLDLRQIIGQGGFEVFVDDAALPERAVLAAGPRAATSASGASLIAADRALAGWRPVLTGPRGATAVTGSVPAGTVVAAVAPSSSWELVEPGGRVVRSGTRFGYAAGFDVSRSATVTVRYRGSAVHGLEIVIEVLLWLVALGLLVGRRRTWALWSTRIRRRAARRARRVAAHPEETDHQSRDEGREELTGDAMVDERAGDEVVPSGTLSHE